MGLDIKKFIKESESSDFELLPVGKYNCYVFDLEAKDSSAGNPMIVATLKIADGDHKGRRLWINCALTANAWWKFQELLTACSFDLDSLPDEVDTKEELLAAVKEDLLGCKVLATVKHQQWNGKTTENVAKLEAGKFDYEENGLIDDLPF